MADAESNSSAPATPAATAAPQRPIQVRFEDGKVAYASQFLVNSTSEELIVGFSSGVMDSGDGSNAVLPVQSRIAMSRPAAARLVRLRADALRRGETGSAEGVPASKAKT